MSENESESVNNETTPAEDSDIVTLTLNDILDMENEMMEDAAAVLGDSNDKSCSYTDGYRKRQALYSCLTCLPESRNNPEQGAGICLACSYHCHDGHELIELYTKRNFRCDCGNKKFTNNIKCNLEPNKTDTNELNTYNQNFAGFYCICQRPYPDPDESQPDEMIQCTICEDWYHSRHLGTETPTETFAEMICVACVTKHEFLRYYDGIKIDENRENLETCKKPTERSELSAKFWPDIAWRKQLCLCKDCLQIYENEKVMFLIDAEDPVQLYGEKGKAKIKENIRKSDEKLTSSINSLDRVQMVEVIAGYNDLKENLAEYLKKFVESKKVVREEDIREFFDGMMAKKKQKIGGAPPTFCR